MARVLLETLPKWTLTRRIMGIIAANVLLSSWLVMRAAESVHHQSAMEHVTKQALVHLYGMRREIARLPHMADADDLRGVLSRGVRFEDDAFDFSILTLKLFDREGGLIAVAGPDSHLATGAPSYGGGAMHHGMQVFSGDHDHLGGKLDREVDVRSGRTVAKTRLTVPIPGAGTVRMALEAELDLEETMARIDRTDDAFEQNMATIVIGFAGLSLLVIWLVTHRELLEPVRKLGQVTERIATGDLSTRTDCCAEDEIGYLGRSINRMADSIETLLKEEEAAYMAALRSLAKALEAKDAYTAQHSSRVTGYSLKLGQRLGLSVDELSLLKRGAMMHDLGKIGIPDAILNKPGPLADEEFEVMKTHPMETAAIMRPLKRFKAFTEIGAWHHERWDGRGYPDGLKGDGIPLLARIVSIADTWDAMTGDRVYRQGMAAEKALSILDGERDSGQFDPELLDTFLDIVREESGRVNATGRPMAIG